MRRAYAEEGADEETSIEGGHAAADLSDSSNRLVDGALPTKALTSTKSRFPPILGFRVSNLFLVSSFIAPLAFVREI